ncbi:MAG: YD repeat-containing protein, partial [Myxococcota bacterium]
MLIQTSPGGASTNNLAFALGGALVTESENVLGWSTVTSYDGMGRPVETTDPNDVSSRTVRDALGRPLERHLGAGGVERLVDVWSHTTATWPQSVQHTAHVYPSPGAAAEERVSHTVFDGLGREAQVWAPPAGKVGFTVVDSYANLAGDVRYVSEPYGATTFDPSTAGDWTHAEAERAYPDGSGMVRRSYALHPGWSTQEIPAPGVRQSTGLLSSRRSVGSVGRDSSPGDLGVDSASVASRRSNAADRVRALGHDVHGRLEWVEEGEPLVSPLVRTGTYAYDGRDRVLRFTDANGNAYAYDHDGTGRLRSVARRGSGAPSFQPWMSAEYVGPWPHKLFQADGDDADLPSSRRSVGSVGRDFSPGDLGFDSASVASRRSNLEPDLAVTWSIDALGRPHSRTVAQDDAADAVYAWTWSSTWHGGLKKATDPWGEVRFTLDEGAVFGLGHTLTETRHWADHADQTWTYTRDSAGGEREVAWPGGAVVTHDIWGPTGWLEGHTLTTATVSATVDYAPGSFGAPNDGWSVPGQAGLLLDLDIDRS